MKCKMIIGCALYAFTFVSCNSGVESSDSSDYGVDSTATYPKGADVQPDSTYTVDSSAGGGSGRSSSRSRRYNLNPSDTARR